MCTGALSAGCSLSPVTTHRRNKCLSENLYPEQPRCFYFIGNINLITAGIFFPALVTGELKAKFAVEIQ